MVRPRPEQTWLAGGLPQADGGVVLPPARLQIAVAAGLMESREVFGGGVPFRLVDLQGERGAGGSGRATRGQKQWPGLAAGKGCLGEILHSARTQNLLNLHWKVIRNLLEEPGADCQGRGLKSSFGLHNT